MPRRSRRKNRKFSRFLLVSALLFVAVFLVLYYSNYFKAPAVLHFPPSQSVSLPSVKEISIASFNIRLFSNKSRGDEELDYIVKLLKDYDVIAIQELLDPEALRRAIVKLKTLGLDYGSIVSPPVGRGVKELYAFIYRKDKVRLLKGGQLYRDIQDDFIREPYYASFKSGDFDFTLITVHILWGGNNKNVRRPEIAALNRVYQDIQDSDPQENDVILLGDFNLPPDDRAFTWLKIFPTMSCVIKPPNKTTIRDTSLIDNLCFEKEFVREYSGAAGVNRFDETIFNNDDDKASLFVSDHRLIWSVYNIPQTDDD